VSLLPRRRETSWRRANSTAAPLYAGAFAARFRSHCGNARTVVLEPRRHHPLRQIEGYALPTESLGSRPPPANSGPRLLDTIRPRPGCSRGREAPAGAIIDYFCPYGPAKFRPSRSSTPRGVRVRRCTSDGTSRNDAGELANCRSILLGGAAAAILSASAWLHRWFGICTTPRRKFFPASRLSPDGVLKRTPRHPRRPARAVPCNYQVRLTVGDRISLRRLVVTLDPRVRVSCG